MFKKQAAASAAIAACVLISAGPAWGTGPTGGGIAYATGENLSGQLGIGDSWSPQPSLMTDAQAIAVGGNHCLVLKADCTVWAWGSNTYGQLGDEKIGTSRLTPEQVLNLTNVAAIAAGYQHSLALKTDGTVWAWGKNVDGQLGDGTTSTRTTPVQVQNLTGVAAIAAGWDHSLFLVNVAGDFDGDGDLDGEDLATLESCASGPTIPYAGDCGLADLDHDNDVDHSDVGIFQACFAGEDVLVDPDCARIPG